jgi:hypothetical protein
VRRRARAPAVISEAIGIPPHLSLSNGVRLAVDSPLDPATAKTIDRGPVNNNALRSKPMKREGLPRARRSRVDHSRGLSR